MNRGRGILTGIIHDFYFTKVELNNKKMRNNLLFCIFFVCHALYCSAQTIDSKKNLIRVGNLAPIYWNDEQESENVHGRNVSKHTSFLPGTVWKDTKGHPINAHGGGVIYSKGSYYWYGEHKIEGRSEAEGADGGVHCYSSTDLYNWQDEGMVLAVDDQPKKSDIEPGCILERPKVVYNQQTQTYVMYFKFYPKGTGYDTGYVGVATASCPTGPFTYQHKFLGAGSPKGSGDFCMYQDEDGTVYHFTVRKPDKAFCGGRLKSDYLYPENDYRVLSEIPLHTEAPAMVRTLGKYYMLGSGSSGWAPNSARAFSSPSITGEYSNLANPCVGINPNNQLGPEKTFGGQISFILPVEGMKNAYIALFDIWNPGRASDGLYVWLPLQFKEGNPVIEWQDRWDLSFFKE
ncbi:MAG: family 43 glycosylhydrolase [Tannerellaceae bacterium]|jgi:hypothetical protein|nr:family 43 glycosylhydrolase [Tannerellaceae bacterium]